MDGERIKVVDLFCGAGGFSHGFKEVGFDILYGVDIDGLAAETYQKNIGPCLLMDVNKFEWDEWPKPDIVIGSPPCQDFSMANVKKRQCDLKLVDRFFNLVQKLEHIVWIMEEVDGVFHSLKKRGHTKFYFYRIDAADYGVPSRRRRFFASNVFPILPFATVNHVPASTVIGENKSLRPHTWDWNKRISDGEKPAPTITSKSITIPEENGRLLSIQETAALMTYPDNFIWPKQKTVARQQIGNSVPPLLSKKIAETIAYSMQEGESNGI